MKVSEAFLDFVMDQLSGWGEVQAKRMFGGAGLYRRGVMFGLVADDVLYLKTGEANLKNFQDAGSRPFRPYPNRKTVLSYYEIPPQVLEDRDELARWAEESAGVALAKKGKKSRGSAR